MDLNHNYVCPCTVIFFTSVFLNIFIVYGFPAYVSNASRSTPSWLLCLDSLCLGPYLLLPPLTKIYLPKENCLIAFLKGNSRLKLLSPQETDAEMEFGVQDVG
jgi:hypothetical protein